MPARDHPASAMLDLDTARRLACGLVAPIGAGESLDLAQATGRTAATSLRAEIALPRSARSAMDGFALCTADLASGLTLPVAGTVAAGMPAPDLPRGAALRIFTGAQIPAGADAVVPIEEITETGASVQLASPPEAGAHIRAIGSEQPEGGLLLRRGTRVRAHHIGLLAANGVTQIEVVRRPRLAILSTGDELHPPGGANGSGDRLPDVNRPMLIALAQGAGAEVDDHGILPDDPEATAEKLAALQGRYDLIVTSGAVSMGGRDHLRPALLAAGGEIDGWRVALKPGKPVMLGRLGPTAVTGLPGNPFSALVGFTLFVSAQIARLKGAVPAPLFHCAGRAGFDWHRKPGRAEIFPIRLGNREIDGLPVVHRLGEGSSATLFPLAEADGLGFVSAETARVGVGTPIGWQSFEAGSR